MFCWIKHEESGQGMVEYGLILALISLVALAALTSMGVSLQNFFERMCNELDKLITSLST